MKFIQLIHSQYDNKMKQVEVNRDVLLHLKKSIEHPLLVEDKNYIPKNEQLKINFKLKIDPK